MNSSDVFGNISGYARPVGSSIDVSDKIAQAANIAMAQATANIKVLLWFSFAAGFCAMTAWLLFYYFTEKDARFRYAGFISFILMFLSTFSAGLAIFLRY